MYFDRERERFIEHMLKAVTLVGQYDRAGALRLCSDVCCNSMLSIALELNGTHDLNANLHDTVRKLWQKELPEDHKPLRAMVSDSLHYMDWSDSITEPTEQDLEHHIERLRGLLTIAYNAADQLQSEFIVVMSVLVDALDVGDAIRVYAMYDDALAEYQYFLRIIKETYRYGYHAGLVDLGMDELLEEE